MSPTSAVGKLVASALIVWGVCYTAMPLAIIGGIFTQVWRDRDVVLIALKVKRKLSEAGYTGDYLEKVYKSIDVNGDGSLSASEFAMFFEKLNLGMGMSRAQFYQLFHCIDTDNSGALDFSELYEFLYPDYGDDLLLDEEKEEFLRPNNTERPRSNSRPVVHQRGNYHEDLAPLQNTEALYGRLDHLEQAVDSLVKKLNQTPVPKAARPAPCSDPPSYKGCTQEPKAKSGKAKVRNRLRPCTPVDAADTEIKDVTEPHPEPEVREPVVSFYEPPEPESQQQKAAQPPPPDPVPQQPEIERPQCVKSHPEPGPHQSQVERSQPEHKSKQPQEGRQQRRKKCTGPDSQRSQSERPETNQQQRVKRPKAKAVPKESKQ